MGETAVTEEVSAAGENMNSVKKKEKDSIRLVRAVLSDAEELYELQKACFQTLLEKYQDYELNPAAEPLEKTIGRLRENFTDFYFIMLGNRKIGGVRIRHRECKLGPIFLLTEYQGFGYAQETICQAEGKYPESVLWRGSGSRHQVIRTRVPDQHIGKEQGRSLHRRIDLLQVS